MSTGQKARRGDALTEAERKVVALVASDLLAKQIGERLSIADKTVHKHIESVRKKLGTRTLAGIAVWWVTGGKDQPAAPKFVPAPPTRPPKAEKPARQPKPGPVQREPWVHHSMSAYCDARGIA